jgi:cysteine synthase B
METSIVPGIYKEEELDGKFSVPTDEAYDMVEILENQEGILVGHSSAAAMVGALKLASQIERGVIVTVFPDSCEKCYVNLRQFKKYYETHSKILPKSD